MKKKVLVPVMAICVALAASFSGCGSSDSNSSNSATAEKAYKVPDEMSKEVYDCGLDAVSVLDDYLNGKADLDSAYNSIASINSKAQSAQSSSLVKDRNVCLAISTCESTLVDIKSPFANGATAAGNRTPSDKVKDQLESLKTALEM